jgi:hypothetical protein
VSYAYQGTRGPVTGVADITGMNVGNWTITFSPAILNFTVPEMLVYKIQTKGALGSTFSIYVDTAQWDVNLYGPQNSWYDDTGDSLVLRPGQNLYLLYSDPTTDDNPPVATIYLRYDLDKWGNM